MSRRGVLTPREAQYRAASRMTVGTKMWTEQPVPEDRPRFVLVQGADEGPLPAPDEMRYIDIFLDVSGGTPGASMYVTLAAGESAVLVVTASVDQPVTLAPGWEGLDSLIIGGVISIVVSRVALVDETTLVCTVGPEASSLNTLNATGFALLGPVPYRFIPRLKGSQIGNPITLHSWAGFPGSFRLRALSGRGSWLGWNPPGEDSEHGSFGFTNVTTTWWSPGGASTPEVYLTGTWPAGTWSIAGLGLAGPVTWCEWHIKVGRA